MNSSAPFSLSLCNLPEKPKNSLAAAPGEDRAAGKKPDESKYYTLFSVY